jgi:Tol biopolymer transport system component
MIGARRARLRRNHRRGRLAPAIAAFVSLAVLLPLGMVSTPSRASFPGQNGPIAFLRGSKFSARTQLWMMNADGGGRRLIASSRRSLRDPAWSPDGRRIAFTKNRGNDTWDIYVMDIRTRRTSRITRAPVGSGHGDSFPAWSPDGRRIAFERERRFARSDIYVIRRNGGRVKRLTRTRKASSPA